MMLPTYMSEKWQAYWQMSREDRAVLKNNSLSIYADECADALIPYLEVENGIPANTLSVSEKRLLIAKFIELHRVVGTPYSIMEMLSFMALHSAEFPAKIIEYKNNLNELYEELHSGLSLHNGTSRHNGAVPIYNFHLRWYQIKIILTVPISAAKTALAYMLIKPFIPVRCELLEIIRPLGNFHDGVTLHDGTTIHA